MTFVALKVTRVRTLSRFLDNDNWEDGVNPYGTLIQVPMQGCLKKRITSTARSRRIETLLSLS